MQNHTKPNDDKLLDKIQNGLIPPELVFDINFNIDDYNFEYPIEAFKRGEGSWDINNNITYENFESACSILHSKYLSIYYLQQGDNDGSSWVILAKTDEYYISFDASCDFTGFSCNGGGSFCYYKDWKTLWNMGTTHPIRDTALRASKWL